MHGFCAHTRCRGGRAGCSGAFVGAGRWCACCRGGRLLVLCSSLTPGFVQAQSLSIWDRKSLRGTDDLFLCPSHDTCRWSYRSPSSGLFSDGLRGSGCAVSCLSSRFLAGVEITGRVLQAEDGDVTTCPRRHGGERWGRTLRCTFRSRPRTPPLGSSSFSPQTPGRLLSTRSGGLSVAPFSFRPPSRQCIFGAGGLLSAPVRDARRAEGGRLTSRAVAFGPGSRREHPFSRALLPLFSRKGGAMAPSRGAACSFRPLSGTRVVASGAGPAAFSGSPCVSSSCSHFLFIPSVDALLPRQPRVPFWGTSSCLSWSFRWAPGSPQESVASAKRSGDFLKCNTCR